jgi:hypothetical protein
MTVIDAPSTKGFQDDDVVSESEFNVLLYLSWRGAHPPKAREFDTPTFTTEIKPK